MTNYSTLGEHLRRRYTKASRVGPNIDKLSLRNPAGKKTNQIRIKSEKDLRKKLRKKEKNLDIYSAGWMPGN